jgi:hypothetical protein
LLVNPETVEPQNLLQTEAYAKPLSKKTILLENITNDHFPQNMIHLTSTYLQEKEFREERNSFIEGEDLVEKMFFTKSFADEEHILEAATKSLEICCEHKVDAETEECQGELEFGKTSQTANKAQEPMQSRGQILDQGNNLQKENSAKFGENSISTQRND